MGIKATPDLLVHIVGIMEKLLESNISYGQEGEDSILFRFLHPVVTGFYIDVGCNDPEVLSVTKFFYDRGWNGINIDPLQAEIDKYTPARERDTNYCLAISDHEGEMELFGSGDKATFDPDGARRFNLKGSARVHVTRLATLLGKSEVPPEIHFLKIDVEKHEREVLAGMDFTRYRPWVVVVESTVPGTWIPCHEEWEHILLDSNYVLLTAQGINRYYGAVGKYEELVRNCLGAPVSAFLTVEQAQALQVGQYLLLNNRSVLKA